MHFGYPPLMRKMYENDGAELVKLCNKVHAKGAAMSLDLAAVDPESPEGLVDWREFLSNVLPHVDFFVPSIEELCFMLDRPRYDAWMERAGEEDVTEILDLEKDIRPLAAQAMELGVKVLMLKCGARGMYYQTAGADLIGKIPAAVELKVEDWTEKSGFQKSFIPEKVLSGTGAGDSSIGCFLYSMLKGYPVERCIQLAAAQGASCVEAVDTLSGLHTLPELEEKIAAGWKTAE